MAKLCSLYFKMYFDILIEMTLNFAPEAPVDNE